MKKFRLNRRTFIRGAAGTVIGLPLLQCMMNENGTAHADGSGFPCRFLLTLAPTSLVVSGSRTEAMTPTMTGMGYDITPVLQPLADRALTADVTAISGLFCAPLDVPGGYNVDYHGQGLKTILSGQRSGFSGVNWRPQNVSADELIALRTEGTVRFRKLYYQIDPNPAGQRVSYEETTGFSDEPAIVWQAIQPEVSPANAYDTLFRDFTPPDTTPDPAADLDKRLRESSLSYAREQINDLNARLGANDRRTLDEHLTHIRELERRLALAGVAPLGMSCSDPSIPMTDPSDLGAELPDQEARADLFADLVQMALACDMTRAMSLAGASVMTGSGMRHEQWSDVGGLHGEVQHASAQSNLDNANRWFVDVYARVLERLKAIPEGDGTLLDHTAAVFVMEGGKGLTSDDQRSGDGGGDPNHSCDNMIFLVGGRAGGLVPGQHISLAGADRHPTEVLNSMLRAVGVDDRLGEITGTIDELFMGG